MAFMTIEHNVSFKTYNLFWCFLNGMYVQTKNLVYLAILKKHLDSKILVTLFPSICVFFSCFPTYILYYKFNTFFLKVFILKITYVHILKLFTNIYVNQTDFFPRMINFRWIKIRPKPYWKIMYLIRN